MENLLTGLIPHYLPWLPIQDVVRLSSTCTGAFQSIQEAQDFWFNLDFSTNNSNVTISDLTHLANSKLSKYGKLVKGISFAFNQNLNDKLISVLEPMHLKKLDLNGCNNISDEGLLSLAQQNHELQVLELYWNVHLTDRGVVPVILKSIKTLQKINLSGCLKIGDQTLKALAGAKKSVVDVDLTRTVEVSAVGVAVAAESLINVKRFVLYACHHLPTGSFRGIRRMTYLEELDLCGCKVNDEEMILIVKNCHDLRRINLTWCTAITDITLEAMAQNLKKLEWLSLHGLKQISLSGLISLKDSILSSTLKALDVQGCELLFQDAIANNFSGLRQLFPNVSVFLLHS